MSDVPTCGVCKRARPSPVGHEDCIRAASGWRRARGSREFVDIVLDYLSADGQHANMARAAANRARKRNV